MIQSPYWKGISLLHPPKSDVGYYPDLKYPIICIQLMLNFSHARSEILEKLGLFLN